MLTEEDYQKFYSIREGSSVFCVFDCDIFDETLHKKTGMATKGTILVMLGGPPNLTYKDARGANYLNYIKILSPTGVVGWVSRNNIERM